MVMFRSRTWQKLGRWHWRVRKTAIGQEANQELSPSKEHVPVTTRIPTSTAALPFEPVSTVQNFVTDPGLEQSQNYAYEQSSELLVSDALDTTVDPMQEQELTGISESLGHTKEEITLPSLPENHESFECLLPIEDITNIDKVLSNHSPKPISAYSQTEPVDN
ncbi:unnamed protein product [Euphydryas editha]|uniref:Uncharacterized protein n=1 Tax=Euphydryas editha TaxID=104508 RepID=A0AAU9UJ33_EUPED|nr:unnamed protein product [Euphydryas editha]